MLRLRLLLGFSIAFSILGLCFLDIYLENLTNIPGIALFPLLILLIYLGVREMLHLANRNHVFPVPYVTYLGCGLIAVSAWATFVFQHTSSSEELSPVPVSVSGASASVPAAVPAAGGGGHSRGILLKNPAAWGTIVDIFPFSSRKNRFFVRYFLKYPLPNGEKSAIIHNVNR